jgi:tetratricopeptide (TPR) repeat protein
LSVAAPQFNPFPGLRPFEPDEDHLFFGREKEIDELLRRLRTTRFLSVVGTSGSGKSSLVRSGLIPALHSGFMVKAGTSWRVATMRPGEDPVGHLAAALAAVDVLGTNPDLVETMGVLVEATLRRSTLGLVDAVRQARIPSGDNVLVVVDQFEELFRFRRSRRENSRDEAIGFVKLLLEAARQVDLPIYVVLTMRSDFIGDCMEYPGLAEAVNSGQYLVPRMHRDALRSAITGPVAVGGGTITPRLVLRLLNDIGDDHDQLPVLQHALMRSWDRWTRRGQPGEPFDIADYEDVGTLRQALSVHAEETFVTAGSDRARQIAERVFKALTDTFSDARGVRRPTSVAQLAEICETEEAEVIDVVDVFRQPGRSFLMPPAKIALTSRSIVDLSHESLMRCWDRLIAWAQEERTAAAFYVRLSQAASWHAQGTAGLWRDPELELALRWRQQTQPTARWAERYDEGFAAAMAFLEASRAARDEAAAELERTRRRKLRQARWAAATFALLSLAAASLAYVAWAENARAEVNLRLATAAVEETLSSADVDPARAGADVPGMGEFRRELLDKARRFYVEFLKQNPRTFELRADMAFAHFRLGHISRMLEQPDEAVNDYRQAIEQFTVLDKERPRDAYKQALANAWNWMGETLRPIPGRSDAAGQAYDRALDLQTAMVTRAAGSTDLRQELARTHYNRGILRSMRGEPGSAAFRAAEGDFRDAILLLEPLSREEAGIVSAPDLARACNNLASLIAADDTRIAEAVRLYDRAIEVGERLVAADPSNRRYRLELAQFRSNAADLLRVDGKFDAARGQSRRALELLEALARPAPSLGVELADAHNLRAQILAGEMSPDAVAEYRQSLELFEALSRDPAARGLAAFHMRFGDLLLNLATRARTDPDGDTLRRLMTDALHRYVALGASSLAAGSRVNAQMVLDTVSGLLPALDNRDRRAIADAYTALDHQLAGREPAHSARTESR